MNNNQISVKAHFVDGGFMQVLDVSNPHDAIEKHFMPDMRPPVESFIIEFCDSDGNQGHLAITQKHIIATMDDNNIKKELAEIKQMLTVIYAKLHDNDSVSGISFAEARFNLLKKSVSDHHNEDLAKPTFQEPWAYRP